MSELTVERDLQHWIVRREGRIVAMLSFRSVLALVSCRLGRARWRERRFYGYGGYCSAVDLWPEVEDFGVGHGTISGLSRSWPEGLELLERSTEPGPIVLTELGDEVLNLLLEHGGVAIGAPA